MVDVSDLSQPTFAGKFESDTPAIGHNLYTKGDLLYEANYRSGMKVFDTSAPFAPQLVASFDTYPDSNSANFNGLWSVFPYFDSEVVIGSDIERGLFVWYVGDGEVQFEIPNGLPALASPLGSTIPVNVLEESPGDFVPGSARLVYDVGQGTVETPLIDLGNGQFEALLPPVPCGGSIDFYLAAESASGAQWFGPGLHGPVTLLSAEATTQLAAFDMELPAGWVSGASDDTATTGAWVRDQPIATVAQPGEDHSPSGDLCWFTGQGSVGGPLGENDVDNGMTTLISPAIDLSADPQARIGYWRWFSNATGDSPDDSFEIDVTGDGVTWTRVETLAPGDPGTDGEWIYHSFRPADFIAPTATVRVRFVARDEGFGSIVEAAIDDFEVFELECGPLVSDVTDVSVGLGGTQQLSLDAGPAFAGLPYWLLGSLSGTAPGIPVDGLLLPLNVDNYFLRTFTGPNQPPLAGSFGVLDSEGRSSASFSLPGGLVPQLAGVTAHHAFVTISVAGQFVNFVSNPVPLALVP